MSRSPKISGGPLKAVEQDFEYQSGWVRGPTREIAFNHDLSRQTKELWTWLASVKPMCTSYTWKDCESATRIAPRHRTRCLGQLIALGFVEQKFTESGVIIVLKDPYIAYERNLKQNDNIVVVDEQDAEKEVLITIQPEPKPPATKRNTKPKETAAKSTMKVGTDQDKAALLSSWNKYKPESYKGLYNISDKRWESLFRHMQNLHHDTQDVEGFIKTICRGIPKSEVWGKKMESRYRGFDNLFGTGNVEARKYGNVTECYELGLSDGQLGQAVTEQKVVERDRVLDSITYKLNSAKDRGDVEKIEMLQKRLENHIAFINSEAIKDAS